MDDGVLPRGGSQAARYVFRPCSHASHLPAPLDRSFRMFRREMIIIQALPQARAKASQLTVAGSL